MLMEPATIVEILFDKASTTACRPVAEPPPALVAETFETADCKADAVVERTL
jgi:hypothetical protein